MDQDYIYAYPWYFTAKFLEDNEQCFEDINAYAICNINFG
jgi:hypothetical protein